MATHYEELVANAKKNITEILPTDAELKSKSGDAVIVDVREKDEWDEERLPGTIHLSRGTIEWKIGEKIPDLNTTIICHCGGGGRSALAAESLQKMGYTNVISMDGGIRNWREKSYPLEKGK